MTKKCSEKGCISNAKWTPFILVWAKGFTKRNSQPGRIDMNLYLCDSHRQGFKAEDILTDNGWKLIEDGFKQSKRQLPDRKMAEVQFEPLKG